MIIVQLKGGLGNQMFQYAFGRSLSLRNNTSLFLDVSELNKKTTEHTMREYELNNFNIQATISTTLFTSYTRSVYKLIAVMVNIFLKKKIVQRVKEKQFHYCPKQALISDNSILIGYWNSPKYFDGFSDILRKDFSFNFIPNDKTKDLVEKIKSENAVSLHIRRGDYVTNLNANAYHGICDKAYYDKAIDTVLEKNKNAVFFIFTDDPIWVSQNFNVAAKSVIASSSDNLDGLQDMYLMTQCKHAIIANSTYSWWAAWLMSNPDKMVIAPLKWHNNISINITDLFPDTWITI